MKLDRECFSSPSNRSEFAFGRKMIRFLLSSFVLVQFALAKKPAAPAPKNWPTLSGHPPLVVARGGFSGLFPESSEFANNMAFQMTETLGVDVALLCSLQLTKDGVGICQTEIRLQNATNIEQTFPDGQKDYNVNGNQVQGWFALDFTSEQILNNVSLNQNILSRPLSFDGQPIATVEDVTGLKPKLFWLSVPFDVFYTQHRLSVSSYLDKALGAMKVDYISSPEIGFLKAIGGRVNRARTKLMFEFLDEKAVEPTSNQTYGSILKDLAKIKDYAAGIVVPKGYIWPVNPSKYLEPATTLVADARKLGLEVYASGFANDAPASYNYSYDPTAEYLQFMDNSQFSVDGVITDFPPTAAETIACFAMNNGTKRGPGKQLIISHNGASGMYAGCTDLAYDRAVNDGADIIDCSVQMSKDGVAFCLNTTDLMPATNAVATIMSRATSIPEIQNEKGIFSFDLTWSEIQNLKPQIESPFPKDTGYVRNPVAQNQGKLVTLAEFLEFAKAKAVTGILIKIENAAYLASKKGFGIVEVVTSALKNATFDQQSTQQVLIQSDDTSVLSNFQGVKAYKTVLTIKEDIGDAPKQTVDEIKKFASAVVLSRQSLIISNYGFAQAKTNVIKEMQAANISVFVSVLRNEYVALNYDYFSDPMVELATYIADMEVNGVITDFPGTADKYLRSPCSDLETDPAILPVDPGSLLNQITPEVKPPAVAPSPSLDMADIVDPPLPEVAKVSSSGPPGSGSPGSPGSSGESGPNSSSIANGANIGLALVTIMVISLLLAL